MNSTSTPNDQICCEDTAVLWGDDLWGSAYLFSNGANWASGTTYTDGSGVTANGYVWTDGRVAAKGFQWTDGVGAKSLLGGDADTEFFRNDDEPGL